MARSTFYYHIKASKVPDKYADTKALIAKVYHEHRGRYGYRRITAELARQGHAINHKTVLRLMGEAVSSARCVCVNIARTEARWGVSPRTC